MANKYSHASSYICFAKAVKGQRFSRPIIAKWFPVLVDRGDYSRNEKKELIDALAELTNMLEHKDFGQENARRGEKRSIMVIDYDLHA